MSDCSKHKKEVAGISDMKVLAEAIGDLHYEALAELLRHLYDKVWSDADKDLRAGRRQLGDSLMGVAVDIHNASFGIQEVWKICQPFMEPKS